MEAVLLEGTGGKQLKNYGSKTVVDLKQFHQHSTLYNNLF